MKSLFFAGGLLALGACATVDRGGASLTDSMHHLAPIAVDAAFLYASSLDVAGASGGDYVAMGIPEEGVVKDLASCVAEIQVTP